MTRRFLLPGVVMALIFLTGFQVLAQDAAPAPAPAAEAAAATPTQAAPPAGEPNTAPPTVVQRLSLMTMIEQGGFILWITLALGFAGTVLSLYLLLTLRPSREVPPNLVKRAVSQMKSGDLRGAYQMCQDRDELIARVLRAGLKMAGHDRYVIQEAMESEGERGATALWQRVAYLNSIATMAPLLGLLGTVWGMMQAFRSIALDTSQVKGLTMAYSISQAMITTAGGLIVAIPAMAVYYYLRGRVIRVVAEVEAQASEFIELISEHGQK